MRLRRRTGKRQFRRRTGRSGGGLWRRRLGGGGARLPAAAGAQPLRHRRRRRPGPRLLPADLARRLAAAAWHGGASASRRSARPAGQSTLDPKTRHFTLQVLGSTEDTWAKLLQAKGSSYTPTKLRRLFGGRPDRAAARPSRRWARSTARPTSRSISTRILQRAVAALPGAPGDFAMAYVIAHEVGHHVQDLEGRSARRTTCRRARARPRAMRSQVKVELQADCYAGVWAANAKDPQGQPVIEPGDFEEGMRAAEAIGDDTLQKQTQGRVVPDSFTHGTSAQRMEALQRGFKSGNLDACTSRDPTLQLQWRMLEPDQHLAGVRAVEQAEERVGHVLQAVDDRLARLDRAARRPRRPSRGRIRPFAADNRRR